MELGLKLRKIRLAKGLTVYRLSELTGLTGDHIRKIERGDKTPTVETITRYLQPLNYSLSEFFNENDSVIYATPNEKKLIDMYRFFPDDKADLLFAFIEKFSK